MCTDQCTDHVCTCLVTLGVDKGVITRNQNKTIIEDKGHESEDDPMGRGEGKGGGIGMGKGSTDTKNLRRRSYLQYQG